jgi:hypothetical protein
LGDKLGLFYIGKAAINIGASDREARTPKKLFWVHLVLANMFVGAKHDRIQHGIITNNLSAVMLRPPQK